MTPTTLFLIVLVSVLVLFDFLLVAAWVTGEAKEDIPAFLVIASALWLTTLWAIKVLSEQ
jgi:hypothetical protein